MTEHNHSSLNLHELAEQIKLQGKQLGFADVGITHTDLRQHEPGYFNWLAQNFHGEMQYMAEHGTKRSRPTELIPGTLSLISLRMNYFTSQAADAIQQLHNRNAGYVSRYALGRDYHKVIRQRLKKLVAFIEQHSPQPATRIFVDSAPVLERQIAEQAGLGFIGKNSLLIHPRAGSWFFLAEIYTDLALPADPPSTKQGCGPCTACLQECPTQAIVAPGLVDARRCISYLTIEYDGVIPLAFRKAIGNRIYGCDDCQLVCPWNHFTQPTQEADFQPRHQLDRSDLISLLNWSELEFEKRMEGSPIRRIGYMQWQRNLVIALGNSNGGQSAIDALNRKLGRISPVVDEHIVWALEQLQPLSRSVSNEETDVLKPSRAKKYYLPKGD
jgi:epoxyqueuosine reductase